MNQIEFNFEKIFEKNDSLAKRPRKTKTQSNICYNCGNPVEKNSIICLKCRDNASLDQRLIALRRKVSRPLGFIHWKIRLKQEALKNGK